MAAHELVLVLGSLTGSVGGIGALWLGWRKHRAEELVEENESRVGDVEQRVAEWTAINDRVEADNIRLRLDNDGLRADNDLLRSELHTARTDIAALRKGWRESEHDLPEPQEEP
ncbi:MAG: hypothetical protein H0W25_13765 [Acidimicrobiia bacterium]|nr:hypothetical protein [Acidimicrobiia bacterium]